jgi:hypothetical protein
MRNTQEMSTTPETDSLICTMLGITVPQRQFAVGLRMTNAEGDFRFDRINPSDRATPLELSLYRIRPAYRLERELASIRNATGYRPTSVDTANGRYTAHYRLSDGSEVIVHGRKVTV